MQFSIFSLASKLSLPHTLHLQRTESFKTTQLSSYNATLKSWHTGYELTFQTEVTLGNQTLSLLVDTGSSDIWVLGSNWVCINDTSNATLPQEACTYGSQTYTPSTTFHEIPDTYFGEELGAGRVSGLFGLEDVTLGGVTVTNQHIGVVNKSSNFGDGVYVGIVGFGYPSLTSSHNGSIVNADNTTYSVDANTYNPLFNSMIQQGLVGESYFSIALERTPPNATSGPGGYLTLGGLPPVSYNPQFATVPVEIAPLPAEITGGIPNVRSWWAINVSGMTFSPASNPQNITTNSTTALTIVDTGNWFNYVDPETASAINDLFEPPGQWNMETSPVTYTIDCNARAPNLGFIIGGQTFFHNGMDLVYSTGDGTCVSAVVSNEGVELYGLTGHIIGDAFLKNVVAVFDFGNNEMRFAERTEGSNTSSTSPPSPSSSVSAASTVTWHLLSFIVVATISGVFLF
ncbi:acid protease [Stipitochalara longipes BDJ]|nr:acid protease [Stipitochalara longipes BDJ]